VLELCCFEWFQNLMEVNTYQIVVLELCCFEWFQNDGTKSFVGTDVLKLCCYYARAPLWCSSFLLY
ncbi:TPA: hypothetical protein VAO67_002058, partial [Streptococcus agalactiae]|nr:hypothetical protein [Streptococcus agalactiae]